LAAIPLGSRYPGQCGPIRKDVRAPPFDPTRYDR
jgi:hypothetical protein